MKLDDLDTKLTEVFEGRCVRKDLVQRIKKGTNIPTFVLEFLLARFCSTDDPDEINAALEAVTETIQKNYVRPNESNLAQSLVQQKGKHKYIDKVHVRHNEKEKRHWAEMQNFGSKRIAINDRHYTQNKRLLESGLWCEVTVGYNPVEDDDYTFYIEDLRPIQISRFSFEDYCEARNEFTRDEWLSIVLRSIGLEPAELSKREQFHFLARLFPLIEQNYNLLELGPRGTGKSYLYSEFTPYSTLISGGQTTTATLFYNKQRREVGIIGYWDTIAFDEVAGIKVKDPGTITILKDYMANGHFNLMTEVVAPASLSFVGNVDDAVDQLVASEQHDLCQPLPKEFDLAVIHRFHTYVPGWEIPPNSSQLLTDHYGLITDYFAEALHYQFSKVNRFAATKNSLKLNAAHQGRDETAAIKTVAAFCKILHPGGEPTPAELDEYTHYAIEGRRRIKEQLNKRKKDNEFATIQLGYTNHEGKEVVVDCPESKGIDATQSPRKAAAVEGEDGEAAEAPSVSVEEMEPVIYLEPIVSPPVEKEVRISHGARGYSYRTLFLDYFRGAKSVRIEDPYIRLRHQVTNFLRFCEVCVEAGTVEKIHLVTDFDDLEYKKDMQLAMQSIKNSLANDHAIELTYEFLNFHDRRIELDNGWVIKPGVGLDFYQRPDEWMEIGANDMDLRKCKKTDIGFSKSN